MSEGEAVALIHKVMMRIIMMIITEDGYIFIHIDHQKIGSKIDKSQDSKVCETRPTLVCPMLYTCVPLLHFDSMTMMIWPHPPHIAPYIYLWRSNRTHQGDVKILPLMNAMARMTFSPMRRQFVEVHTGDGCASLLSDFPHVKLLLFGAFLMFLMGKQKPKSVWSLILVVLGTSRQD